MKLNDALKKVKALLSTVKLTQEPLTDGSLIQYSGDVITKDEVIYLMSGADNASVLPDGSYMTKAQTQFTITNGAVSAIVAGTPLQVENKPILQAQASQEVVTDVPIEGAALEVEKEVKLADATVTVDINDVIQAALAPIYQAISDIQNSISNLAQLYVSQEAFSKVSTDFSKTKQAVVEMIPVLETLSKEPSAQPIEKEVNSFRPVPKDIKESMTYKVLNPTN